MLISVFGRKGFCPLFVYSEIWLFTRILIKFDAHFLNNGRNFCENGRNFCRNFEISVDPIFLRLEKKFHISSTYKTEITARNQSVNHLSAEHHWPGKCFSRCPVRGRPLITSASGGVKIFNFLLTVFWNCADGFSGEGSARRRWEKIRWKKFICDFGGVEKC